MIEVKDINEKLLYEALKGLKKGYNPVDLDVMTKTLSNLKILDKLEVKTKHEKMEKSAIDYADYCSKRDDCKKNATMGAKQEKTKALDIFLNDIILLFEDMKAEAFDNVEKDKIKGTLREIFQLFQ